MRHCVVLVTLKVLVCTFILLTLKEIIPPLISLENGYFTLLPCMSNCFSISGFLNSLTDCFHITLLQPYSGDNGPGGLDCQVQSTGKLTVPSLSTQRFCASASETFLFILFSFQLYL